MRSCGPLRKFLICLCLAALLSAALLPLGVAVWAVIRQPLLPAPELSRHRLALERRPWQPQPGCLLPWQSRPPPAIHI